MNSNEPGALSGLPAHRLAVRDGSVGIDQRRAQVGPAASRQDERAFGGQLSTISIALTLSNADRIRMPIRITNGSSAAGGWRRASPQQEHASQMRCRHGCTREGGIAAILVG